MGPTLFYGARAEKKTQKADFAMKQTNICRLSGDIKKLLNSEAVKTLKATTADRTIIRRTLSDCLRFIVCSRDLRIGRLHSNRIESAVG